MGCSQFSERDTFFFLHVKKSDHQQAGHACELWQFQPSVGALCDVDLASRLNFKVTFPQIRKIWTEVF